VYQLVKIDNCTPLACGVHIHTLFNQFVEGEEPLKIEMKLIVKM
jgi:hypothetical protein